MLPFFCSLDWCNTSDIQKTASEKCAIGTDIILAAKTWPPTVARAITFHKISNANKRAEYSSRNREFRLWQPDTKHSNGYSERAWPHSLTGCHLAIGSTERVEKGVSSNCPIRNWSGVGASGGSSTARRRVSGERPPALQAQGSGRKHHW